MHTSPQNQFRKGHASRRTSRVASIRGSDVEYSLTIRGPADQTCHDCLAVRPLRVRRAAISSYVRSGRQLD
ncbi:hypothetical protein O181_101159 [Austropuccinia psidii MF-1]|uniref:Uncharacterized protein n=1 Tax=Austropuccinia psidii MF-1 TaxID=1389203 RepID=A0A9Q3JGM4_9BASI|nr:hypothetical protein [Austropuccinia psidii MF-1]